MQVMHDVYMMLGNVYANIANIFVVKGPEGLILFDTADREEELDLIDENLHYWGLYDLPITHVFISHNHFNHIGNAHRLRARGAKIVAGEADADAMETGDINQINDCAPFPARRYTPCPVDVRVKDGAVIHAAGLEVSCIHVPGHTAGSMFYRMELEGKTVLFTGDVLSVAPDCMGAKMDWEGALDHDRIQGMHSVRRIAQMHADILLPAHFQLGLANADAILEDMLRAALDAWRAPMLRE